MGCGLLAYSRRHAVCVGEHKSELATVLVFHQSPFHFLYDITSHRLTSVAMLGRIMI